MSLHVPETPTSQSTEAGTDAVLVPEETMSRDELEALQLGRLQHTVAYAYDRVPAVQAQIRRRRHPPQ